MLTTKSKQLALSQAGWIPNGWGDAWFDPNGGVPRMTDDAYEYMKEYLKAEKK